MTKAPFGFDYAADGVTLIPNQWEQRFAEVIIRLYRKGLSLENIAEEIEAAAKATNKPALNWTGQMVADIMDSYNAAR